MKIRLSVSALNEALDVVSIVPPQARTPDGGAGFLFVLRGGRCSIYSRDQTHQARVDVPFDTDSSDAEGSFIFPADKVQALKFLDGWIQIESGKTDERDWIKYETEGKAEQELSTIDPRLMQSIDAALEKTTEIGSYPSALLREAISTSRPFIAKPNSQAEDQCKVLQLFDASKDSWKKGDGYFFSADGVRACFFYCEALKGKGLTVHGQHLPFLTMFLARSPGDVTVRQGEGVTYVVNAKGQVLGWAHSVKQHEKFGYYALKRDDFILKMPKDLVLKALRYVRAGLDQKKDKIRVQYSHEEPAIRFLASESTGKTVSMPVGVKPVEEGEGGGGGKGTSQGFAVNASLNQMIELFDSMKTNEADLRVAVVPATPERKESALFRTIDTFWIDSSGKQLIAPEDAGPEGKAYQCQVTRFMPSRE